MFTAGGRRARARAVAAAFARDHPALFPDARTERHVVAMLANRNDLAGVREALAAASPAAAADVEILGAALDAHARKGDLDRALPLAKALAAAHAARAATGVGASAARPPLPAILEGARDVVEPTTAKRYGPPERLLRNFRRLCRTRRVAQPDPLPPDPVLVRQAGARLRRSKRGERDIPRKRAYLRVGK